MAGRLYNSAVFSGAIFSAARTGRHRQYGSKTQTSMSTIFSKIRRLPDCCWVLSIFSASMLNTQQQSGNLRIFENIVDIEVWVLLPYCLCLPVLAALKIAPENTAELYSLPAIPYA